MKPRLLPEWAPQIGTLLVWPHQQTDWAPHLSQVEPVYCALVNAISDHQSVIIICYDAGHQRYLQHMIKVTAEQSARIQYVVSPYNDTWIRDYGPLSIATEQGTQWLKFHFNAWGQKYASNLDNQIVLRLTQSESLFKLYPKAPHLISSALTLEGGGLETDGAGTLLTTSHCLLSPKRMPNATKETIETQLTTLLDLQRILWLDHGQLPGDDTDGHIDTLVRFCSPTLLCYQTCDDITASCYGPLQKMEQQLKTFTQLNGEAYHFVALPWPNIEKHHGIVGLPATYANFLITGKKVLVPTYDVPADREALNLLTECFPNYQIEGINCLPLIKQFGSLHCATMQLTIAS